jgi:hypothetical protein
MADKIAAWIPVTAAPTDPANAQWSPLERFLARALAAGALAEAGDEFRWAARCELVDGRIVHRYLHVAANRDVHLDAGGNPYRSRNRDTQVMLRADRRRPATVYAAMVELVGLDVPHSIVAGWSRRMPRRSGVT